MAVCAVNEKTSVLTIFSTVYLLLFICDAVIGQCDWTAAGKRSAKHFVWR